MDRQRWTVALVATIGLALALASPSDAQNCRITAPASVAGEASFTLCGPTTAGYTFEWHGPGLTGNVTSRCATAGGLSAGTYEFLLIRSRDGVEVDRCVHVVNVGGRSGGTSSCRVSGPGSIQSGSTATLCAPNDGIHSYSWKGPNGFTATTACITVSAEGTYFLTSRNPFTGSSRTCTHRLDVVGGGPDTGADCAISGPEVVASGGTARLCATSRSNTTYRWTGPGGFTATSRCITVSAPGTYTVTLRNLSTGRLDQCARDLRSEYDDTDPDAEDPDAVYRDNCPRDLQFWRSAVRLRTTGATGTALFRTTDLQALAREIDRRSTYFNWSNDLEGLRAALNPAAPLTRRKQIARQYAALLANVTAGELGIAGEEPIGLDLDTPVTFQGASTIGELVALTERWLRDNRGNFSQLNARLNQINRGRGIGPVCNDIP
jgi:hypothetical protein